MMPAIAPNRPPRISDSILYRVTGLPRERIAFSSSRMPLSMRPHGEWNQRQHSSAAITTKTHATMRSHQELAMLLLYVHSRNVVEPSGSGESDSNFSVKSCGEIPAEPPVKFVMAVDLPMMRMSSAAANVTMAR